MKTNRLYELLPIIYRQRDLQEGDVLLAFLDIIETELNAIEKNIEDLYRNWFIETCDEWVISYIGELLGVHNLDTAIDVLTIFRLQVANTIRNRRRKGTLEGLQNSIYATTGWPTEVIPYFERLSITQTLENIVLDRGRTIDLHQVTALELLNQPFDPFAHTIDVHRPDDDILGINYYERIQLGEYDIQNIGIFLWRLRSFPVQFSEAAKVKNGCFSFNPLEVNIPLFRPPCFDSDQQQHSPSRQALPIPLSRHDLPHQSCVLDTAQILVDDVLNCPPFQIFIFPEPIPVRDGTVNSDLTIALDGTLIDHDHLIFKDADLSEWSVPDPADSSEHITVFVDVTLGRIALPSNVQVKSIFVNYAYGFSTDLGGGPYTRQQTLAIPNDEIFNAKVTQMVDPSSEASDQVFPSLVAAIQAWSRTQQNGLIQIYDNGLYDLSNDEQTLSRIFAGHDTPWSLTIEAADGFNPCVIGTLNIWGGVGGSQLILNGLWLRGSIALAGNVNLRVQHCTIRGAKHAIDHLCFTEKFSLDLSQKLQEKDGLEVTIEHSIVTSIHLPSTTKSLTIRDSIVDGEKGHAIAFKFHHKNNRWGPPTQLDRATIFGAIEVSRIISANSVIFADPVKVKYQQDGSISFSYIPLGSITPPRYQCQPDLLLKKQKELPYLDFRQSISPIFTSRTYGNPGYAQLRFNTPIEILTGAEQGSQMGVFSHLAQAQRLTNLQTALQENFPYGLTAKLVIND